MFSVVRICFFICLVAWAGVGAGTVFAEGPIRVGLYVQFEDGSSLTRCVELDAANYPVGEEATGLDVLRQSGLDLIFETGSGFGAKICKLGKTGCDYPAEDCFCRCQGTPCQYWTYWYAAEGQWKYSAQGASSHTVKDGDVEAWVWGSGKSSPPADVLAAGICPVPATATPQGAPPDGSLKAALQPTPTSPGEMGVATSLPPTPTSLTGTEVAVPSPAGGGPSAFMLLVVGLSAVGITLLGLAYFATRRRS